MRFNGFIAAILVAIVLAWLVPEGNDLLPLKTITDIGIGLIFLFYGLKLSPVEFRMGLYNYKVHLLVQFSTFLLFPLLVLALAPFFETGTSSDLWLALFFLGALPSTVSSSIVMVSLARGNVPTAIFNASLSGLLGVVLTPLWMSFFLRASATFEFSEVFRKLFLQVILPLVIGLALQRFLGKFIRKHASKVSLFDKSIIFLIVYSSFSKAFSTQLLSNIGLPDLLKLVSMVVGLFFLVYFGIGYLAKKIGLNTADRITAKFSGTKKSFVHGSVMVQIIFGNSAGNALFLLPIMMYHILQLLVIAIFAEGYRKRDTSLDT